MGLEKIVTPVQNFASISWLTLALVFMAYVSVRALVIQGGVYLFVTRTRKAFRQRVFRLPFGKGQLASEFRATLTTIFLDGIFIAALVKAVSPNLQVHNVAFTFALSFVWFEIWFYFSHRLLHTKAFYFLHQQHHVAMVTSPLTALSFSLVERLLLLVGGLGFMGLVSFYYPIAPFGTALYLFANYLLNVFAHLNVEVIPPWVLASPIGRLLNAPSYHSLHHARYKGHYGLFTPFLDRWLNSSFSDYREVQRMAYAGHGLTAFHQRLEVVAPVVLITGASSGIGEAMARVYAKDGFRVVLCARRLQLLEKLSGELRAIGAQTLVVECDVRDRESVKNAVQAAIEKFGQLDVTIANAGIGVYGDIESLAQEDFERQFATNIYGVLNTVQETLPHLKKRAGKLAIMGSAFSYLALPATAPYAMSKYAVRALAETLFFELRPAGVSVTLLCPGTIASEFRKVDNHGLAKVNAQETMPAFFIMDAQTAAVQMKRAIDRGRREAVITFHGKFSVYMRNHFPWLYSVVIARMNNYIVEFVNVKLLQAD